MSLAPSTAPLLQLDDVAAIIRDAAPSVRADALRYIGSGWDFDAFLTIDGWVFRFPRKPECGDQLDLESRVCEMAARVLPPLVRVPRMEVVRQPSAFALPFARYRYVEGSDANAASPALLSVTARDIGVALGAVHMIPVAEARAVGVGESAPDDIARNQWFQHAVEVALGLRGLDPVVDRAIDWIEASGAAIPPYHGPLRFTHNDFGPDHLLVDRATGALTGILDWTDATLGDPARDFVVLLAWQGWEFTEQALAAYPLPLDPLFRERLGTIAKLMSVLWLANAHEERGDVAKHIRWVQNSTSADPRR